MSITDYDNPIALPRDCDMSNTLPLAVFKTMLHGKVIGSCFKLFIYAVVCLLPFAPVRHYVHMCLRLYSILLSDNLYIPCE